jgi:hypothetical protein
MRIFVHFSRSPITIPEGGFAYVIGRITLANEGCGLGYFMGSSLKFIIEFFTYEKLELCVRETFFRSNQQFGEDVIFEYMNLGGIEQIGYSHILLLLRLKVKLVLGSHLHPRSSF